MKLLDYEQFEKDEKQSLDCIKEAFKDDPAASEALEWVWLTLRINILCNLIELKGENNEQ